MSLKNEPWRYNPGWDTAIVLDGCQLGLEHDGRCDGLFCKFRTTKDLQRKPPMQDAPALCIREMTYEKPKGIKIQR